MPTEIEQLIETIEATLAGVPGALLVILLLAGPTAVWLIVRLVSATTRSRYSESSPDLLWICSGCRSANGLGAKACYRCGAVADEEELEVIVSDPSPLRTEVPMMLPGLDPSATPVAVGPGRQGAPGSQGRTTASTPGRDLIAVGPGHTTEETMLDELDDSMARPDAPVPVAGSTRRER